MLLTGSQIVMECLMEQGVDTVFGYPGGAVLYLYDALYEYRDQIRHIRTAHEQGAAHAADGYARSTGKTGVCIATSGPGATNLVTGIATAYMDSVPMVAITGNVTRDLLGLDSFQEVDITGITMPVTKHNFLVKHVEDLASTLRRAFEIAGSGRKGPVLVDIPKDVTALKTEFRRLDAPAELQKPCFPTEERFAQALEMIEQSERPFLYCGGGVVLGEASAELSEFAEKLDAPVSCSLMCQGGYDQTAPRYLGMLGMHGTKASAEAIKNCDLLIAAGTRFSDRVLCNAGLFGQNCRILQIDIDSAEFNKNIDVDLKMKGDVKAILARLNELLPKRNHADWVKSILRVKREYPLRQVGETPDDVLPQEILETLCRLAPNAVVSTDVGQHQMWTAQFFTFREPKHFLTSGGLGTMGYGLGAALGAQAGNPEKRVVNITGDGSFHMNCAELSTLARCKIPVIEIVFNNSTLGMVRQWQKLFYESRFSQTDVDGPTNYEMLANAFGVKAMTVRTKSDIEPVLREALSLNEPVLINCLMSKDINVLPMVPAGGSVADPMLEM